MEKVDRYCLAFLKKFLYNRYNVREKVGIKMNKKNISIIVVELIIFSILYGIVNSNFMERIPQCWIYDVTGLLCPACGGTRCVIYMLKGNWLQAFSFHGLFFIGILYLLSVNLIYIINLNKEKKIATWLYPKYWYGIIFVILLMIYTIMRNLL